LIFLDGIISIVSKVQRMAHQHSLNLNSHSNANRCSHPYPNLTVSILQTWLWRAEHHWLCATMRHRPVCSSNPAQSYRCVIDIIAGANTALCARLDILIATTVESYGRRTRGWRPENPRIPHDFVPLYGTLIDCPFP
jgi:hypothetical protein